MENRKSTRKRRKRKKKAVRDTRPVRRPMEAAESGAADASEELVAVAEEAVLRELATEEEAAIEPSPEQGTEATVEPSPEQEPEVAIEPAAEQESEAAAEPASEQEPEAAVEPSPEQEPEAAAESDSEQDTKTVPAEVRRPHVPAKKSDRRRRHRHRRNRKKIIRLLKRADQIWRLLRRPVQVLLGIWMLYLIFGSCCVKSEVTVEVGEKCPKAVEFTRFKNRKARFVSEINEDTTFKNVGDYYVVVQAFGRYTASVVHVKDTVAPEVVTRDAIVNVGDSVKPEAFIKKIKDQTKTSLKFKKKPDSSKEGTSKVLIEVKDAGGNITEAEATLRVVNDHEPPVISGVEELTMTVGGSISYKKGVKVTDNYDEEVKLEVDTSEVDTNKAGDYKVVYIAVDAAGNEASVSTTLHVKPVSVETVTEEMVNARADELLATILTDGMSQYDQAKAIYWWCHDHIAYSDGTPKTNWIQGAYRGIVNRKGDCYTYAATAKCLLTRAGITNMDIERIPRGNSMHYWNLIDIGEGWHHFDTCRRADGSTFFYKNDAEIKRYSDAHNGTHNYDRSKYPAIP